MATRLGLKIEVDGRMRPADMSSLAWMGATVLERIAETTDIVVYDPKRKVAHLVVTIAVVGDSIQLTVEDLK